MRRTFFIISLLVSLGLLPQACRHEDPTAPSLAADAAAESRRISRQLMFTVQPPLGVAANAAISPALQVTVTDASGDVVSGSGYLQIEIGASPSGDATLSGTTRVKVVDGVATFTDLRIDQPGRGYTLRVRRGAASSESNPFAVVGPATQLAFVTSPPTDVEGATPVGPAVRVAIQDALGSTVPGATTPVTLRLASNPTGATLAGTSTVSAVDGIATFSDLSIDRSGSYTFSAAAASLPAATSAPFAVHLTFTTVTVGVDHTCGVTTSRAAYCWGDNFFGQLGDGTRTRRTDPVLVAAGMRFASVDAGSWHTCGLTADGVAYCWGFNAFGQLGDGSTTQRMSPAAVLAGVAFTAISAGHLHTCAIATGGAAYCWGDNDVDQLGDGTTVATRSSPAAVAGGLHVSAISAGWGHSCVVTTNAAAYCWGDNTFGQLGVGDQSIVARTPLPVAVAGGLSFRAVSAGDSHSCGVTTDNTANCWGENTGQLGDGTRLSRSSPAPVDGGFSFTAVEAGGRFDPQTREVAYSCGVTTSQDAFCWGNDVSGRLGDGTAGDSNTPVPVLGGLRFVAVSPWFRHTCGLTPDGAAYCWGDNSNGALGNGTTVSTSTPTQVAPRQLTP
jgi:alpha-tubulin suppressor-like RCC1 family protein